MIETLFLCGGILCAVWLGLAAFVCTFHAYCRALRKQISVRDARIDALHVRLAEENDKVADLRGRNGALRNVVSSMIEGSPN